MDLKFSVSLVKKIYTLIKNERNLSFKSYGEIKKALDRGQAHVFLKSGNPFCFFILTRLAGDYVEIHSAYTRPQLRRQGHFSRLIKPVLIKNNNNFLAVTFYDYSVSLFTKLGFKVIPFKKLPTGVKIVFILHRLKIRRLLSIIRLFKKGKPTYLLYQGK